MRHIVYVTMAALTLSAVAVLPTAAQTAAAVPAQAAPKIAYLNSRQILDQAPGRSEAEAVFEKEMGGYRTQLQKMDDSLKTMIADLTKAEPTLSPAVRETRGKAIRAKQEEYQTRARQLEQQAQQREAALIQPIMEQIQKIIEAVRVEENYAFILDAGSNAGIIVAADKNLDITDRIVARLKATAPSKASAASKVSGAPVASPSGVTRPGTRPPAPH